RRITEYKDMFANPYAAAAHGLVDEILEPADTRPYLAQALEVLKAKRELRPAKKHGLIPL
ncbi:MAG TPA: carboxyl transferase domain-containing protein, partial [candidate division Zixibacteria bacterium]|nr:carboxyl transferase domain-containing protein [candidate division Zixibacteria bacterium]